MTPHLPKCSLHFKTTTLCSFRKYTTLITMLFKINPSGYLFTLFCFSKKQTNMRMLELMSYSFRKSENELYKYVYLNNSLIVCQKSNVKND